MLFLEEIVFNRNVEFESKRESQKDFFKIKTKISYEKNYRKIYVNKKGRKIVPREKIVENTFTIFKKGLRIKFEPLTIIVGDNGCGKTSFVNNIIFPHKELKSNFSFISGKSDEEHQKEVIEKWINNENRELKFLKFPQYVIVEKEIHKTLFIKNYEESKSVGGFLPPKNLVISWEMQSYSNGECNLDFLKSLQEIKNSIIILDEPETSLSIKSQIKIANLIKNLLQENQVIIITHSEPLMMLSNKVYDFEKKRYKNTKKYIEQQKKYFS